MREAARIWRIPMAVIEAEPADGEGWLGAAEGGVEDLLAAERPR